tara:strand:+ start:819 stop:1016 length:198 start_codon:yes stop_codon:yes gene_type:complete
MTACIGIITNGFINETIIIINIAPPPKPKAAVMVEVKKLAKQRRKNSNVESSGTLVIISVINDMN